jgi:Flp pilus assembly protein TadD
VRDDGLARAHHTLGLLAARQGHDAEAERHFRRALDLDPANYDAMLNLGSLLARRGRGPEARPFLERFVGGAPAPIYARQIERARAWLISAPRPDKAPTARGGSRRRTSGRLG